MWGHGRDGRGGGEEAPRYIVAGEIVRTTRMYAMSVSPLSLEILERISPILLSKLGGAGYGEGDGRAEERHARGEKVRRYAGGRDFTNNVRIGGSVFPLETVKGKKHARLAWETLAGVKEECEGTVVDTERYRGLRGTVVLGGTYRLLSGEKLSLILTLLPGLDLDGAVEREWPREETFYSGKAESLGRLVNNLPLALRPALARRGRPKRGDGQDAGRENGELGFIGLWTNGEGAYWFRCSRGFHTSLNESISSLEALIDELGEDMGLDRKHVVNQTYRRLSDMLGG
jgi:hypothetical protein